MSQATPQFGDREPASKDASRAMQGNQSRDTKPEMMLRRALWHRGHRYRLHRRDLPGNPDIVFASAQLAVFCDGDFWHGRNWPRRKRKLAEGSNADYWIPKIRSNMERDERYTRELEEEGWTVLRLWESEIKDDPQAAADAVESALQEARDQA